MVERVGQMVSLSKRGPWLAGALFVLAFTFVMGGVARGFLEQRSVNDRLCESTVANRQATRGVWEGARDLAISQFEAGPQRFAIREFFDSILAPYPPLECVDGKPMPVAAVIFTPVSFLAPPPPKKPDPQPPHGNDDEQRDRRAGRVPCIPNFPITCPPPPSRPGGSGGGSVPRGDDPPRMGQILPRIVWPKKATIVWPAARDDEGIRRYRLYRNGRFYASAGPRARQALFWFPCGLQVYAVEAVDTSGQRDASNIVFERRCRTAN